MWKRIIDRVAYAGRVMPEGAAPFLAGILLLAVPIVAMVAGTGTTAPTEPGHWIVLLIGVALAVYGVFRGTDALA